MKKNHKPFVLDLIFLAIVAGTILLGFGLFKLTHFLLITPLKSDDVSSVHIYDFRMNEAEQEEFISLFNASEYRGKKQNQENITQYHVYISLRDGREMEVKRCGEEFIVIPNTEKPDDCYYVKNDALRDFVKQTYEVKYAEQKK